MVSQVLFQDVKPTPGPELKFNLRLRRLLYQGLELAPCHTTVNQGEPYFQMFPYLLMLRLFFLEPKRPCMNSIGAFWMFDGLDVEGA